MIHYAQLCNCTTVHTKLENFTLGLWVKISPVQYHQKLELLWDIWNVLWKMLPLFQKENLAVEYTAIHEEYAKRQYLSMVLKISMVPCAVLGNVMFLHFCQQIPKAWVGKLLSGLTGPGHTWNSCLNQPGYEILDIFCMVEVPIGIIEGMLGMERAARSTTTMATPLTFADKY